MDSRHSDFSQECIGEQNQAQKSENGSQGAVANDKELAKKMRSVKLGTGDMIKMMQKYIIDYG